MSSFILVFLISGTERKTPRGISRRAGRFVSVRTNASVDLANECRKIPKKRRGIWAHDMHRSPGFRAILVPDPAPSSGVVASTARLGMKMTNFSNFDSHGDLYYGGGVARFSFGLLVVSSPNSVDDHSSWDPARENVHAGKDSVHVPVRQSASGLVAVACVEEPAIPKGLALVHRGVIQLARSSIVLYDPNGQLRLELPVERDLNAISVYGDDPAEPAEVVVVLGVPRQHRPVAASWGPGNN